MADEPKKGLISFLYHVLNDPDVNEDFHRNEVATMREFDLPRDVIQLIVAGGRLSADNTLQEGRAAIAERIVKRAVPEIVSSLDPPVVEPA